MMNGYSDNEYHQTFKQFVKWTPADDQTLNTILTDQSSTKNWNPVIFCIFYWRSDILKMLIQGNKVNMRECLSAPFIVEIP